MSSSFIPLSSLQRGVHVYVLGEAGYTLDRSPVCYRVSNSHGDGGAGGRRAVCAEMLVLRTYW